MAYGEAEHGCVQGEPCRPGPHEHPPVAKPGVPRSRAAEPGVPRSRAAEPPTAEPEPAACRSQLPGWAGGHRHGPVRPAHRTTRRERPPRRWC
ncbi:hypothetical protein QQG74_24515 [Micromonospora sp. FIMYZ51]|uniref:hypothetical protein n=1 Tax=Micromonospora sp. FIMYZ51 TaxID=3051832 RepID=UPI00311D8740